VILYISLLSNLISIITYFRYDHLHFKLKTRLTHDFNHRLTINARREICISTFWLEDVGGVETWLKWMKLTYGVRIIHVYNLTMMSFEYINKNHFILAPFEHDLLMMCDIIIHLNTHNIGIKSISYDHGMKYVHDMYDINLSVKPEHNKFWIPVSISKQKMIYSLSFYLTHFGFNPVIYLYVTRISQFKNLKYYESLCGHIICALIGHDSAKSDVVIENVICLSSLNVDIFIFHCSKVISTSLDEGGPIQSIQALMYHKPVIMFPVGLYNLIDADILTGDIWTDVLIVGNAKAKSDELYWQLFSPDIVKRQLSGILSSIIINQSYIIETIGCEHLSPRGSSICVKAYNHCVIKLSSINDVNHIIISSIKPVILSSDIVSERGGDVYQYNKELVIYGSNEVICMK
jgi:hypothetical protein